MPLVPVPGSVESWTRDEMIEEIYLLRHTLTSVRNCQDPRCSLCASCVTALFVTAKPSPSFIPAKYVGKPWRKRE